MEDGAARLAKVYLCGITKIYFGEAGAAVKPPTVLQTSVESTMSDSLRPFGIVLEKSLRDLIRGIRAARDASAREAYIKSALADCRVEARSPDLDIKTMAVLKLAYLEMYGHDLAWAGFHVLEVMASPKLQQKRVGYLAATQSFRSETDVLMLTTNLIKKDLTSSNHLEVSTCLGAIACIVTPSLAADICSDLIGLLNHSKPVIRKKAILAMAKVVAQYPEALNQVFLRIKDKLNDADPSVVSATVNVLCELAKQIHGVAKDGASIDPGSAAAATAKMYLQVSPRLYDILTTSKNNWMLIKILKFFSLMAPFEPRLKPKLFPPVLHIMETSQATSLLYECINCLVSGRMLDESDTHEAQLCVSKLAEFIEQSDPNLRYVGLQALIKIVKLHPNLVSSIEGVILDCMDDPDVTIRDSVLQLISHISNEDNLYSIVSRLVDLNAKAIAPATPNDPDSELVPSVVAGSPTAVHLAQVIKTIVKICSADTYAHVPDFDWYVEVLGKLARMAPLDDHVSAELVGKQIRDVAVRVTSVRGACVELCVQLSLSAHYCNSAIMPMTLWVLGEYASYIPSHVEVLDALMSMPFGNDSRGTITKASTATSTSSTTAVNEKGEAETVQILIPCVIKVFSCWARSWANPPMIRHQLGSIVKFLEHYSLDKHYEVQERAIEFLELCKVIQESINNHEEASDAPPLLLSIALPSLFNAYELRPVGKSAIKKVAAANANPIFDEPIFDIVVPDLENAAFLSDEEDDEETPAHKQTSPEETAEQQESRRKERLDRIRDDPFYIGGGRGAPAESSSLTKSHNGDGCPVSVHSSPDRSMSSTPTPTASRKFSSIPKKKVEILRDEGSDGDDDGEDNDNGNDNNSRSRHYSKKGASGAGGLGGRTRLAEMARGASPMEAEAEQKSALDKVQQLREELDKVEVRHKKIKKDKTKSGSKEKPKKKKKKAVVVDDETTPEPGATATAVVEPTTTS